MDQNIIEPITTAKNELEHLVTEHRWELALAHLSTIQGQDDARKENPNTHFVRGEL